MKIKITIALLLGTFLLSGGEVSAQKVGLKTNLLYWGTATPNLGAEFYLGPKTSLDISGNYNPFTFGDNKKWKHWFVQPEFRLWRCETFNRGFWGFHAMYGEFNAGNIDLPLQIFPGLKNNRLEGYFVGGGVSYGHQFYLGPHWNLETTFGFGYLYSEYDRYEYQKCGADLGRSHKHYIGPTKVGVTFVYLFKSKN